MVVQLKFESNNNGNPFEIPNEISMKQQCDPLKKKVKFQWNTIWNIDKISIELQWKSSWNLNEIPMNVIENPV